MTSDRTCEYCGSTVPGNAAFCPNCGSPVSPSVIPPSEGAPVTSMKQPVAQPVPAAYPSPPPSTYSSPQYVPPPPPQPRPRGYPDADNPSGFVFKIALSAVAPTVIFAEEAQTLLAEEALNPAAIERASDLCARACKPIDDIRSSAEYRRDMIRVLARQGLEETCKKLGIVI